MGSGHTALPLHLDEPFLHNMTFGQAHLCGYLDTVPEVSCEIVDELAMLTDPDSSQTGEADLQYIITVDVHWVPQSDWCQCLPAGLLLGIF